MKKTLLLVVVIIACTLCACGKDKNVINQEDTNQSSQQLQTPGDTSEKGIITVGQLGLELQYMNRNGKQELIAKTGPDNGTAGMWGIQIPDGALFVEDTIEWNR